MRLKARCPSIYQALKVNKKNAAAKERPVRGLSQRLLRDSDFLLPIRNRCRLAATAFISGMLLQPLVYLVAIYTLVFTLGANDTLSLPVTLAASLAALFVALSALIVALFALVCILLLVALSLGGCRLNVLGGCRLAPDRCRSRPKSKAERASEKKNQRSP
jgi:hypothetical protein